MAQAIPSSESAPQPVRSPYLIVLSAWLIPGAGHLLLGRRGRGAIVLSTVLLTFLVGTHAMRGFIISTARPGDFSPRLIQYGGFVGDLSAGFLYFWPMAWILTRPMWRAQSQITDRNFLLPPDCSIFSPSLTPTKSPPIRKTKPMTLHLDHFETSVLFALFSSVILGLVTSAPTTNASVTPRIASPVLWPRLSVSAGSCVFCMDTPLDEDLLHRDVRLPDECPRF